MKKRFIKSLAALSSAVMLFGAVAQPVDYSFKFSSNHSIMTADAAPIYSGSYGGRLTAVSVGTNAYVYVDVIDSKTKTAKIVGSSITKISSTAITYIVIPETTKIQNTTYTITEIGDSAFKDQTNLNHVYASDKLKYIRNNAFMNCTNLKDIYFDGLKLIGNNAFKNCSNLWTLNFPYNTESIGDYAFDGCKSLEKICLSKECTSIGKYAFANCTSITKIDLSQSSITTIPDYAFNNCSAVEISLPKNLTNIGEDAFRSCNKIKNIYIPETTNTIGSSAFAYCSELTTVIIPEATNTIGSSAFLSCNNLKNYVLKNPNATIGTYAMGYTTSRTGPVKLSGVTIWGNGGTAKTYASKNSFTYKNISNAVNSSLNNMKNHVFPFSNTEMYIHASNYLKPTNTYDSYFAGEYEDEGEKTSASGGFCFGMAMTSVLARNGYLDVKKINNNIQTIADADASRNKTAAIDMKKFINVLQLKQIGVSRSYYYVAYEVQDFFNYNILNEIECITYGDDVSVLTYAYNNKNNDIFAHAVVCLGLEYGDWNYKGKKFDARILIYDVNDSYKGTEFSFDEKRYIYVNTNDGSWLMQIDELDYDVYHYVDNKGNIHSQGNAMVSLKNGNNLSEYIKPGGLAMLKDYGCTHPSIS